MSLAFPDVVDRTPAALSESFNAPTEDNPIRLNASVEIDSEIRYGNDGEPVEPHMIIMFPRNTVMNKGDYITVVRLHGQVPTTDEAVRRKVKIASRVGGSIGSQVEVIV